MEDDGASRVHAVILSEGGRFLVEDAGSRNGTLLNGRPVERQALAPGDVIGLGQRTEIEFQSDGSGGRRPLRKRRPSGGLLRKTHVELVPRKRRGRGALEIHARATTVGREPPAQLVLEDDSVSRLHARLDRRGGELFVIDLKSRNGTRLNGEPVLRAALEDGDVVSFGDVELEVVLREPLAWGRLGLGLGVLVVLVAVGFGVRSLNDYLVERSAIAEAQHRLHTQALQSVKKGIDAYRQGDVDYARSYLLYAADVLLLSNLSPPGSSLDHPEEVFRRIARELPAEDREFDFTKALDPSALPMARARLEGLSNREYVERQTRRIAIELGQDEKVPAGFVEQVWQFVDLYSTPTFGFQSILDRSPGIQQRLREILAEAHLPEVFCYVAWVESGLNPLARSSVGARGLWQFMESTARLHGLRVVPGQGLDERVDPTRSTYAATRYIGNLIRKFGREQFMCALASYNRGEYAVWRAMEKIPDPMMESSHKFWYLVENRLLPRETSEYVPKIFAAQIVAEDPERFGLRKP